MFYVALKAVQNTRNWVYCWHLYVQELIFKKCKFCLERFFFKLQIITIFYPLHLANKYTQDNQIYQECLASNRD